MSGSLPKRRLTTFGRSWDRLTDAIDWHAGPAGACSGEQMADQVTKRSPTAPQSCEYVTLWVVLRIVAATISWRVTSVLADSCGRLGPRPVQFTLTARRVTTGA